ncbi:MAG: HAMP domain-containing sensor histidine kinase [Planctomycetota bacterium]
MFRFTSLSISLAAKCRLLFGSAVVVIVAAALFVPWLRMRDLVHEANTQVARQAGRLAMARSDLSSGRWEPKQRALDRWWPTGAAQHGFHSPSPRLLALSDPSKPRNLPGADEYVKQAAVSLAQNPALTEAVPSVESVGRELVYRIVLPYRSTGGRHPPGTLLGVVSVEYPVVTAKVDLWINFGLSLMAGALAGTLAVLVFYLITQKLILSPVRALRRVAEGVSQGEHSIRSKIATGDEFEELARAFNAMLSHLEASENELKTINKSLDTRLGELAERNVALFEANKIKSQFLANVSHELRTPMTSIIGFAELLRESATAEGGRTLRYSENIMSSGRMLLGIINDLLDLAKMEAGKLELHIVQVNMQDMASNLVDFMRPLAEKKSLQLVSVIPPDLPVIESDAGRIQQILYNLLSNAMKFTPEGGVVELKLASVDETHISIIVRDTGIGIPSDKLSEVFEKFRQLDDSMTREHSGTGLGLAISKELVSLLAGSIAVASAVGKGSEFTVVLPIAPPPDMLDAMPQDIRLT